MATFEVVIQVVVAEIDITLRLVELSKNLSAEDGAKEFVRRVSSFVSILYAFCSLLIPIDSLVEPVQEYFAFSSIPSWLLSLAFFVFLLPILFL